MNFDELLIQTGDRDYAENMQRLRREHSMGEFLKSRKELAESVRKIVADVGERGDAAVAEYTEKFDKVKLPPEQFRVSADELERAHKALDAELLASLKQAIANVWNYQSEIFVGARNMSTGIRYTPLRRVALCIPGASAPLPSTVIMTAVPAQVAGVKEIAVLSPPRYKGSIHPVILGVCFELGISEVYRIGGAQAVAAAGWGTKTIAKVDKIAGPGHDVVQLAKKEMFGMVDMDSFAGPSDVLIVANEQANPAWVAADMLSQAEHDPGAGIVVTDSLALAKKVIAELATQCAKLDRAAQTEKCLRAYSAVVVCPTMDAVIDWANDFAAEHLQVQCGKESKQISLRLFNAGAIFIGPWTPVAVGDYWAGPSHTLPTRQTSKYFSALTCNDFIKSTSVIEYSQEQLVKAADDIIRLARTESLDAHAKSVQRRLQSNG
ncbi:MAG: histidinol dehydrogenase [Planctomycetaceae bacterium]|nr:histidinol dehydrogenase [Planctomycetaceae bacterium]